MRQIDEKLANEIVEYIKGREYSPTVREIAKDLGVKSTATVQKYLERLRSAGRVKFEDNKARTVRV